MSPRKLFAILALLVVAGCHGRTMTVKGRSMSFGAASLWTEYAHDEDAQKSTPLCHVLFVPQWDVPKGGYGTSGGSGGTRERAEFGYTYAPDQGPSIDAQPLVLLDRKTVEGGGRRFDLAAGNVIVAAVERDGSLRVSQLPSVRDDLPPAGILAHVQAHLRDDPRVQALKASS